MKCKCRKPIVVRAGTFRNKNRVVQRYRCSRCRKHWSEPQPMSGIRTDFNTALRVAKLVHDGASLRSAARTTGLAPATVRRIAVEFKLKTTAPRNAEWLKRKLVGHPGKT